MRQIETATTKAKNPSTGNFEDVTWGGISIRSASGSTNYNDLTNKPTINGVTVQGTLTTGDLLITAADVGALPNNTKYGAAFSLSIDSGTFVITAQLKDQDGNNLGAAQTIDLPLETMVVGGSYDDQTQKIILTLKNGQTVEFSVSDLVSGLQTELSATNKLNPAYIDYDSTHAAVSEADKTNWSGKQDAISDLSTIRSGASAGATAVQPSALNDYQTKLSGTNKLDPSYIDYDASHRAVSDTEKSTWNGKQDAISDLATIRSGAAAGATALQQSDVTSTYSASGTAPVNGAAINAAIGTLDVSSVGGSGKYISSISETDGKISATPTNFDTSLSSSSTNNNAPTSKTVFDDQQRQEVEIGAVANVGAKNLLKFDSIGTQAAHGYTYTSNGVTFTLNADMSVKAERTQPSTSLANCVLILNNNNTNVIDLCDGEHILSGCPSGGSSSTYEIMATIIGGSYTKRDYGNGVILDVASGIMPYIQITIRSGFTGSVVFKPMIRPASITDSTFQPYALPNPTLTPAAIKAVDEGAKNRFLYDKAVGTTETIHGRTFTIQSDGGIKVETTGTVDADADFYLLGAWSNASALFDTGSKTWIPVCSCTTKSDNISLRIYNRSTGSTIASRTITSNDNAGISFDFDLTCAFIKIGSAQTIPSGGIVVYPMICTAKDWAVSQKFVPYAPTNRELYEMIQALRNNS